MTTTQTGTSNAEYDLISILYHALEGATTYESYCQDAEQQGDTELQQFFQEVKEQSRQCAERAKTLLASRLAQQPAMR
ncbi:MAG: hypothetical protein KME17_24590 [Cyanosarcina radialis HA8281-LM2]|jgi:rubrerythrin|nr:hypothetical protein [Cyanosarcina radialis HA8281-LM2]